MTAHSLSTKKSTASRKPVVLVVEDHVLIRQAAMDIVNDAGFEALEAQDADEAIRVLEARRDVSLVFTDVEMPGTMDGLKLVHYIRDRWPPVHLIVASGRTIVAESDLPEGVLFFSKPYHQSSIVQRMREMLSVPDEPA